MRRLLLLVGLLFGFLVAGAAWYAAVEGFGILDAAYQAVTTLSTVGFQEIRPLDDSGRIFTMFYILSGVGLLFYVATTAVEIFVVGEVLEQFGLRRRSRRVRRLDRHFIICGFGRVGREVARELTLRREPFVIVDTRPETLAEASAPGSAVVRGDATEEETLVGAGIQRARGLIACADSDVENTYIVLTARALNPGIFIVARAGTDSAERRMTSAGADRVISPYRIGGRRMAMSAVQPMLLEFVDQLSARQGGNEGNLLAEVELRPESALVGRTIAEAFRLDDGLRIMGIDRPGSGLIVGPRGSVTFAAGDRLIVYGEQGAISNIAEEARADDAVTTPNA